MAESALIVRVPEAEALVGPIRDRFDSMAALGVPAHVTVLYPFIPPERISTEDVKHIGRIAGATASFRFRLVAAKLFQDALYLDVEPARLFAALTEDVARAFPQYPPYEGRFPTIIPHLTVARGSELLLQALRQQIADDARLREGIAATCNALVLIENSAGNWRVQQTFQLAGGAQDAA